MVSLILSLTTKYKKLGKKHKKDTDINNYNNTIFTWASSETISDYLLTFVAGNWRLNSWARPCLSQQFIQSKFLSCVWCDPLISG